jgi:hypothetical protein
VVNLCSIVLVRGATLNMTLNAGLVGVRARIAAAAVAGVCGLGWSVPAAAYRPFDGTDAAVADLGDVEIEFQPAGAIHTSTTTALAGPNAVFNYGFAEQWELVLQAARPLPEDAGPSNVPNASLVKYVIRPGALQDKPGPSVATEFGLLYPDFGVPGTVGFSLSGIVSQRWDWGTVHVNLEADRTPDQHPEAFIDTIIEGPIKWKVRPVAEIYADSVISQSQTYSALAGAIWQVNDKLSFDIGVRYALVNGRPVNELRAGMTFGFPLNLGRPMNTDAAGGLPLGKR